MGAVILGAGISNDKSVKGSVEHAILAAKECLKIAKVEADDVDFIINTGIYRENNIVEPAVAMLIQKELGMNGDYVKAGTGKDAFGFDLLNGGIGALNALKIADSMLESGAVRYVLIVGGDSHPSNTDVAGFPYTTVGSAILLGKGKDPKKGIQGSAFRSKQHAGQGRMSYIEMQHVGVSGRQSITITTDQNYIPAARDLAIELAKDYIQKNKLNAGELQLISTQLSEDFSKELAKSIGVSAESSLNLFTKFGDVHSAVFGLGFHQLQSLKKASSGTQVLFLGAGAGLDAGVVHYVC
jgi:3-oxoacyl-[acyl-carrier-protein] synthase-3